MQIALYQPDIPQNTGTLLRLGACMNVCVHIIEPTGFNWSEPRLRRAGLDYTESVDVRRHVSFDAFLHERGGGRLLLLTTRGECVYTAFEYRSDDILLLGRESAGVPETVHHLADARLTVPMAPEMRSLNVAIAAAMVLGEALRQTGGFAEPVS